MKSALTIANRPNSNFSNRARQSIWNKRVGTAKLEWQSWNNRELEQACPEAQSNNVRNRSPVGNRMRSERIAAQVEAEMKK